MNNVVVIFKKIVRSLTKFAWSDFLYDVSLVEWKFGRNDDGSHKDWSEWRRIQQHLKEMEMLRK